MARSGVTLEQMVDEIRHETDIFADVERFPDGIIYKWIHGDICDAVLKLDELIKHLYRKVSGNIAIASAAAKFCTSISHTAEAVTLTGFTGLTIDAWIGGAVMAADSDILYSAQISDNTATVVTISVGTDLPALSGVTVLLTVNDSGNYIDISSLSMINYPKPIWEVKDGNGDPIDEISLERARNLDDIQSYDNKVRWTKVGQQIKFALGSGATISGNITVGYYELPTEATTSSGYIDFPIEFHGLIKQSVMIRILKKKGELALAAQKEVDLANAWANFEAKSLKLKLKNG